MQNDKLNAISGCAGIGGLDLGFKWTNRFRTVCYIENEAYPQANLIARMREGILDTAPIWNDFKTFDGKPWRGLVDIFFAGIPCQPYSMAGKRNGAKDDRNLWPDMCRIVRELGCKYVLVENVPGLFIGRKAYGLTIIGELQSMGYVVCSFTLSAKEVGARHLRNRRFILGILADSELCGCIYSEAKKQSTKTRQHALGKLKPSCADVSNSDSIRFRGGGSLERQTKQKNGSEFERPNNDYGNISNSSNQRLQRGFNQERQITGQSYWQTEPRVGRVVDGVPNWVHRIKALGNAVVPQVAYEVAKKILEIEGVS